MTESMPLSVQPAQAAQNPVICCRLSFVRPRGPDKTSIAADRSAGNGAFGIDWVVPLRLGRPHHHVQPRASCCDSSLASISEIPVRAPRTIRCWIARDLFQPVRIGNAVFIPRPRFELAGEMGRLT